MLGRDPLRMLLHSALVAVLAASAASADTLVQVTTQAGQAATDSVQWTQLGADQTLLVSSFSAMSAGSKTVSISLTGANSVVSVICPATPCSWTGSGFVAGQSLIWTSDSGNGGNGPLTLSFSPSITGAGAFIQADEPGQFTAKIEAFNGVTSLGSFTQMSDSSGDAVYIGLQDQTGANITSVVFSITACGSGDTNCNLTDFALDTAFLDTVSSLPAASFSPPAAYFGSEPLGVKTSAKNVTLTNTGNATLTINSFSITGANLGDFSETSTCGASLGASSSCMFSLFFDPTVAGPRKAALVVNDNAAGSPQSIPLTGLGVAATVSPATLTFPSTSLGVSSSPMTATITNSGAVTMNIWQIAITGTNAGDYSKTTTCGSTLAASANCMVSVTFKPTALGTRTASLLFSDDGAGSPQAVQLTGTAVAAALTPGLQKQIGKQSGAAHSNQ